MALDVRTGADGSGVTSALINWMKSIFGKSFTVSRGYSPKHDGVDLPAKLGTPVFAIKTGVVSYARDAGSQQDRGGSGWAIGGGKVVNVDIGGQLTTQYAHLNSILVKEGQLVQKGTQIGTVGKTGFDIGGSHLHFGLWDKSGPGFGTMIDPSNFFNNIGNTSPSVENPVTIDDILSLIGQTDPKYRITEADARKISDKWYNGAGIAVQALMGKTVQEFAEGTIGGLPNINIDVGKAITDFGNQVNDTVTWIGFLFVGLVLILGGVLLVSGFGGIGSNSDG